MEQAEFGEAGVVEAGIGVIGGVVEIPVGVDVKVYE